MKKIVLAILITFLLVNSVYAGRKDQTEWWTLKKHWDKSVTKDDDLCLEYMSRVPKYVYTVPHERPIRKVAVLPPPSTGRFALKSMGYFEKDVLFNTKEMEEEYLMDPKKWSVTKSNRESFNVLKEAKLYDKYHAFVEEFINYRIIDKDLFSKMADVLDVDTFLLLIIGFDRPGAVSTLIKSEAYYEERFGLLNVYLFDAKEGKIIWEYGCELKNVEDYAMTRWRGLYRAIFKVMPIE